MSNFENFDFLNLNSRLTAEDFSISFNEYNQPILEFSSFSNKKFTIELGSRLLLNNLILKLIQASDENSMTSLPNIEITFRKQLGFLKYMDGLSLQAIISELEKQTLVDLLWYMKDSELIKKTFKHMPKLKSYELLEDLKHLKGNINPDNCLLSEAKMGRDAVEKTLEVVKRLSDNGQISF